MVQQNDYVNILLCALSSDEERFGKILSNESALSYASCYESPLDYMFFAHFGEEGERDGLRALSLLGALYLSVILAGFPQHIFRSSAIFLRENVSIPAFNCNHYEKLYSRLSAEPQVELILLAGINNFVSVTVSKEDMFETFDFLSNGL